MGFFCIQAELLRQSPSLKRSFFRWSLRAYDMPSFNRLSDVAEEQCELLRKGETNIRMARRKVEHALGDFESHAVWEGPLAAVKWVIGGIIGLAALIGAIRALSK